MQLLRVCSRPVCISFPDVSPVVGPSTKCGVLHPAGLGCRGVGQARHQWLARPPSPHYGGYTPALVGTTGLAQRLLQRLLLNIIIDEDVSQVGSLFHWTVLHLYKKRLFRSRSGLWPQRGRFMRRTRRAQQRLVFLWE